MQVTLLLASLVNLKQSMSLKYTRSHIVAVSNANIPIPECVSNASAGFVTYFMIVFYHTILRIHRKTTIVLWHLLKSRIHSAS